MFNDNDSNVIKPYPYPIRSWFDLMDVVLSGGITAEVGTSGDHGHAAGTGRRRLGLAQVPGPNTVIIAEVAARAGWHNYNKNHTPPVVIKCFWTFALCMSLCSLNYLGCSTRERKKRSEKVRRKSRSRSVNPPAFRGRNTAMDAQEALARR